VLLVTHRRFTLHKFTTKLTLWHCNQ